MFDDEEYESYTNLPSWVNNLPATANTPYALIGVDYSDLPSKPIDLNFFDVEGATCSSCQENYPYAIAKSNFVCAGCKLWEASK